MSPGTDDFFSYTYPISKIFHNHEYLEYLLCKYLTVFDGYILRAVLFLEGGNSWLIETKYSVSLSNCSSTDRFSWIWFSNVKDPPSSQSPGYAPILSRVAAAFPGSLVFRSETQFFRKLDAAFFIFLSELIS